MEPVTHFLTGAVLSRAGFNRKAAYATLAMTLAAETPDVDVFWGFGGPVTGFQHHRGITHTFLGLPFEGLVVLGAVWLIHRWRLRRSTLTEAKRPPIPALADSTDQPVVRPFTAAPIRWGLLYCFILVALLSHILLDWTNNYGVRPFFPFNPHWYAGSFVFIFEPVMFALLLVALIAPPLFSLVSTEVGARESPFRGRGWAIFALVSIVALWGWRWFEHNAALDLASNATYGPATRAGAEILRVTASPYPINPYRWHTVVDTPAFYQIGTADTFHSTLATSPERDLFYKPQLNPAIAAAAHSYLGQVYLDWSTWPLVDDIGPSIPPDAPPSAPPDAPPSASPWTTITFRDLRFLYDTSIVQGRNNPPLSATVYIDSTGQAAEMEMSGHVQR